MKTKNMNEKTKDKIYEIVEVLEKDDNQFQSEGERRETVNDLIMELPVVKEHFCNLCNRPSNKLLDGICEDCL